MQRENIARLLPDVFQRTLPGEFWRGEKGAGSLLGALLGVMQDLHEPMELTLAGLQQAFQPDDAPLSFLPFLAGWLDLDRFLDRDGKYPAGNERLRALILEAASLYRLRGTRQGLERFLETATGVHGFRVHAASDRPFHLLVLIPRQAEPLREFVRLVVQAEKPAYATCEILSADDPLPGEGA